MKANTNATKDADSFSLWSQWFSCFIPTTLAGAILFLIATTIVLSLIPVYLSTRAVPARDIYSSVIGLKYGIPRTLISDLSENTMELQLGSMKNDRVKILEAILQKKFLTSQKFQTLRVNLNQASVQSTSISGNSQIVSNKQLFRARRLASGENIIIYQGRENSTTLDQLQISFQLVRRGTLTKSLTSSALINIFDRIEFNTTTFLSLFGTELEATELLSLAINYHVKDNQIIKLNGVNIFGEKDYTGNVQSIYAIQTDNVIYTILDRKIIRIQSMIEALVFDYDNLVNQYKAVFISQDSSYVIPTVYETPNITFTTSLFDFPMNETVPDIFTGVLVELSNRVSGRWITDATLVMNYFDTEDGNKSVVMLTMGDGRYYAPIPTNDELFDKYFDPKKLFTTTALQSGSCLQLFLAYPIADICSQVPDTGKSFCTQIVQEMTTVIPHVLRVISQRTSSYQWHARVFGQPSNFVADIFLPGQEFVSIPLNTNNRINTVSNARITRNTDSANADNPNPKTLNKFAAQAGGSRGQCNEQTISGSNTPDNRIIDIGKSRTTVKISYQTYTVKDQIDVYYKNQLIFSTGCIGTNGDTTLSLNDNQSTLKVHVIPNCAGDTQTQWYYSIQCPKELICEDNICYCGLNREKPQQIVLPAHNGCGGDGGGVLNTFIDAGGGTWGFRNACNTHDECYDTCGIRKSKCDDDFFQNMRKVCDTYYNFFFPQKYMDCVKWASGYYSAVNKRGTQFFLSAQKSKCTCTAN
ncbi:unnamed protein product [Adineta ricciae]|uniref:Uncharacterized protein n=1 Tax=Adineta ricciae TaxID=249248 RepID=A0A816CN34_ADIRI|nr:unnamed protein product [Adineta ricciae]CAF1623898.1 unnamed protein product [Adineta ricciae]